MAAEFVLGIKVNSADVKYNVSQFNRLNTSIRKTDESVKRYDRSVKKSSSSMESYIARKLALVGVTTQLARTISNAIKGYIDFELALTRVGNIAGLTEGQIKSLSDDLLVLSAVTGISTKSLLQFAEAGARFGLKGRDLDDFTESLALFERVTGKVTQESQREFAKLKSITDDTGISFEGLANAVVTLGQAFPTTEAQIVRTSKRIASDLSQFNVGTDFALGLGTAVEATGLGAERASTALAQVTRSLQKLQRAGTKQAARDFKFLAEQAGLTEEEFRELAVLDPAAGVIKLIENGDDAALILQKLNENGTRTVGTFATLSNNANILTEALSQSSSSIKEANKLLSQQNSIANTTSGKIDILKAKYQSLSKEAFDGGFFKSILTVADDLFDLVYLGGIDALEVRAAREKELNKQADKINEKRTRQEAQAARDRAKRDKLSAEATIKRNKLLNDLADTEKEIADIKKRESREQELLGASDKDVRSVIKLRNAYKDAKDEIEASREAQLRGAAEVRNLEIEAAGGDEGAIKKAEDKFLNSFLQISKYWDDALKAIGDTYQKKIEDITKASDDELKDRLKTLKKDLDAIKDQELQQRRDFNDVDQAANVALTSDLEIAEFEASLAGVEREREQDKQERLRQHKENQEKLKEIRDEASGLKKEFKKRGISLKEAAKV